MNKHRDIVLTPELRFKMDDGSSFTDWKIVPLKSVAKRQTEKNADQKIVRVLTNSAVRGVLDQGDYFDKDIAIKGNLQGYYIVDEGDYVYNPRISATAPVGPISKNKIGKGVMSPLYTIFSFDKENSDFYEQFFKSSKWHSYLQTVSNTGARHDRMSISANNFMEMPVPNPDKKEEQKIADCLSSADELITAQNKKLKALINHKKSLMQQIFPVEGEVIPKLRFSEFLSDGEWKSNIIQSLIDSKIITGHLDGNHGALYPRREEFSKKGVPYITANDFVDGEVSFKNCKRISEQRAKKFKKGVAKSGDILFAHNGTVGPVSKLNTNLDFVILSTTATYYRCNNKKLLNDFLLHSLSSPYFVQQYSRVMAQSTRNQIPITTQRKFFLLLPQNHQEQQKIAELLTSLNKLIMAQTGKIESLKSHKKGLYQQLFPTLHGVHL